MSVIVYKNCQLVLNGAELSAGLTDLTVTATIELLDATVFGLQTRTKQAGLQANSIAGTGFLDTTNNVEYFVFNEELSGVSATINPTYESGAVLEPALFAVFPDGVVAGGSLTGNATGTGYVVRGVVDKFILGGKVGTLTTIQFSVSDGGADS